MATTPITAVAPVPAVAAGAPAAAVAQRGDGEHNRERASQHQSFGSGLQAQAQSGSQSDAADSARASAANAKSGKDKEGSDDTNLPAGWLFASLLTQPGTSGPQALPPAVAAAAKEGPKPGLTADGVQTDASGKLATEDVAGTCANSETGATGSTPVMHTATSRKEPAGRDAMQAAPPPPSPDSTGSAPAAKLHAEGADPLAQLKPALLQGLPPRGSAEQVSAAVQAGMLAATASQVAASPTQAATTMALPTGPGDAAFASTLSTSVVMLANQRIQNAELTLKPADLGPISVKLSMNGNDASIAFGATLPETRHAIEAALPTLKTMLADQGLQLSQSSVGDHPRNNDPQHGFAPASGGRESRFNVAADQPQSAAPATPIRSWTIGSGRVDLFA